VGRALVAGAVTPAVVLALVALAPVDFLLAARRGPD
jgi:hypothetical protein